MSKQRLVTGPDKSRIFDFDVLIPGSLPDTVQRKTALLGFSNILPRNRDTPCPFRSNLRRIHSAVADVL